MVNQNPIPALLANAEIFMVSYSNDIIQQMPVHGSGHLPWDLTSSVKIIMTQDCRCWTWETERVRQHLWKEVHTMFRLISPRDPTRKIVCPDAARPASSPALWLWQKRCSKYFVMTTHLVLASPNVCLMIKIVSFTTLALELVKCVRNTGQGFKVGTAVRFSHI